MKKKIGEFSSVIKGIQSNIIPSKIRDLGILGNNIDRIKAVVELEVADQGYVIGSSGYKRECGRRIGIIGEYIASLGFLLKVPFLTNKYGPNFQLYSWDKKNKIPEQIKSILEVSGGGKKLFFKNLQKIIKN